MSIEAPTPRNPIVARQKLTWPGGAAVAVAFVVNLEHYELQPPDGLVMPASLPGGMGRAPYPDFRAYSQREYGNRVGIFRLLEAFDRHDLKAAAAVDVWTLQNRPELAQEIRQREWEFVGHGHAVTRVMSSEMSETQETQYLESALLAFSNVVGIRPEGWHGPEYGQSSHTLKILASLGFRYVLDLVNDEQPFMINTAAGALAALPMAAEFDDVLCLWHRKISPARWQRSIADAMDQLIRDGKINGRVFVLNLHPWLIGQPHRMSYFEEILARLRQTPGLWFASPSEIVRAADPTFPNKRN